MDKEEREHRFVNGVLSKIRFYGSCAVFRVGDQIHLTKSVSNVPELLAVYDSSCPREYIEDDARGFM